MSFIINDIRKSTQPKSEGVSKETLYKMGCKLCPLNNADVGSPKMAPSGSESPLLYVLAEAPGRVEDEKGEPLVGESGQLLKKILATCLNELGVDDVPLNRHNLIDGYVKEFTRFNNCVRNRPPSNRTPTWHEIECCRQSVENDIIESKPYVIIGTGNIPLDWMIGEKSIMQWRGSCIPKRIENNNGSLNFWYFPTIHPSYVLRNNKKTRGEKSQEYYVFYRDFKRAAKFAVETFDG